jgi:hypothetical protein
MPKIKITQTSTVTYDPAKQDLGYYSDQNLFNSDQIALHDVQELEDEGFSMDDVDGGEVEHEYIVVLLDDNGNETEPDSSNDVRNYDLFPDEEDEDEDTEAPGSDPELQ